MIGEQNRTKQWPGLIGLLGLLALRWAALAQSPSPEAIYQAVLPSVMTLEVEARGGERLVGTAFLTSRDGLAATAWHLVQKARKVSGRFADGQSCTAAGWVDFDAERDIALLRVNVTNRPLARLCVEAPHVGSRAYAVGSPCGFEFSLSDGLISQVRTLDGFRQYQVSCPISPGNSGGPVLNARGEVLGLVAWTQKDAQNLSFATPAADVLSLDPFRPVVVWGAKAIKSHHPTLTRPATRTGAEAATIMKPAGDRVAFEQALRQASGQNVIVILSGGKEERVFTFNAP